MRKFIYICLANLLALYFAALVFPAIHWDSFLALTAAAVMLAILNWFLRPLLMLIALPLNIITVGLFMLVINAWMVMLAGAIVKGWHVPGFWLALITSVLVLIADSMAKKLYRARR